MKFNFETAIKIRNHYKDILIGQIISDGYPKLITGVVACVEGKQHKAVRDNALVADNLPLISVRDKTKKIYMVYVYSDDGADIIFQEIDKLLTDKNIDKIYLDSDNHPTT